MNRLLNNSITNGGKYCLCLRVAIKTQLYGIRTVYFIFNIGGKSVRNVRNLKKEVPFVHLLLSEALLYVDLNSVRQMLDKKITKNRGSM